ncbi:hypothetical protein EKO23_14405 [Nocardioides guangzhouensis]|uniref:Glycosyltransferase RgtA/B/C/D-like domain-containing protein n=1 Tax=Nocardioides guangzhouensis TaxID=2497878 RepID=A0A4Q4ZBC9_9ACTN|nr:hypothetical protein [Nocardioides guangzhouensis]RYP84948.1 hypothetical protein EKO23_14405 [Nocardioides guangzhouensis]
MIVAQLAFRAWAISGSWFQFDDFAWLSIVTSADSPRFLLEGYGGHLMPAGFALTWLLREHFDPLDHTPEALVLLGLQALASVGCFRLLRSMFGDRWFTLTCLAVYLFSAVSLPAYLWWAAGINQLPLQVAFFFGLTAHLEYLRSRRRRHAVWAALWLVAGLLFYEKTLLVGLAYVILAFGWFCSGTPLERIRRLWRDYTFGVVLYAVLAIAYVAAYVAFGLNFEPGEANRTPLIPVLSKMVGEAYATGVTGGPLTWTEAGPIGSVADPSQLVVAAAWLFIGLVVYHGWKTRPGSLRAWSLPVTFLLANLLLVTAGRASLVGSIIGLEYRYQTELAAVTAVALGLAFLPLRGAVEGVSEVRHDAAASDLERPAVVALLTVLVSTLALYSSYQFADDWNSDTRSRDYFTSVHDELKSGDEPVPLIDLGVPLDIMWAYRYPENTYSHVFGVYADKTAYPDAATDRIYVFDNDGRLAPAGMTDVRRAKTADGKGCITRIDDQGTIELDGPVVGQGWWLRLGYSSPEPGIARLTLGDRVVQTRLDGGLHALYVNAGSETPYYDIPMTVAGVDGEVCITELTIGLPEPVPTS